MSVMTSYARIAGLGAAALCSAAFAQTMTSVRIASGLSNPVFVTAPAGDWNRLFIVENRSTDDPHRADIKVMNLADHSINAAPFLSVSDLPTGFEQGLLGMAFDPSYATNGRFYISYTDSGGNGVSRIVRYNVSATDPDVADPNSAVEILSLTQPFDDHNGGWIGFGPDDFLYIAFGDGGGGGDPFDQAQDRTNWFGKILRIDVSSLPYSIPPTNPYAGHATFKPEIWAYGLRNPWRNSFDRVTGDFYIGDVGQGSWEEINRQPAANTPPFVARNYGWDCFEANANYEPDHCDAGTPLVFPVHAYQHNTSGGCSVTGGYVYRGCRMPSMRGTYFFGDYCTGRIWSFKYVAGQVTQLVNRKDELTPVGGPAPSLLTSFGEDANGELYFMGQTGDLWKIVPRCYANCDASTIDPVLNVNDFNCFLNRFMANDCAANCDESVSVPRLTVLDFNCFINRFAQGCP